MKLLINEPKVTMYPELLNKIKKYTNLCEHSIYWIGKVVYSEGEYRICDVELPKQTVGKKGEIDIESLFSIQQNLFEEGYTNFCIGRTKKAKSVVMSSDDIKFLKNIYSELETAIYIQTNTLGDLSLNILDFDKGIWFDDLNLEVLDVEFFADEEIITDIEENIFVPTKKIQKTTVNRESKGSIMIDDKPVKSVKTVEKTEVKEIKKVEYVPNEFVKADEPFSNLVLEVEE